MSMSSYRADESFNASIKGSTTPHLMLHVGDPGADGTGSPAKLDEADIVRKPITFGAIGNHATNNERRVLSSAGISWDGTEITAGQTITHFSIWSALTLGNVEFIEAVATPKMVGSEGAVIDIGVLEVAIQVFAKP